MYNEELDSFVSKFRHLWKIGCDAHLDIHAHAGQAWLGLHVRLGHAQGPLHQDLANHVHKSRNCPSRQRHRQRRAAARKEAAQVFGTESQDIASENTDTNMDIIEEVKETEVTKDESSKEEFEKVKKIESAEEAKEKTCEMILDEKDQKDSEENKKVEEKASEEENKHHDEEQTANATASYTSEHSETIIPPVVTIHATAVIDDSPNAALTEEEFSSLAKIIQSKDHLVNNIANIEYSYLSTKEFRTKFKHTVGLVIFVKTCNLWEGARSYIWKHLGRDTWSLNNGSEINFLRIHQK